MVGIATVGASVVSVAPANRTWACGGTGAGGGGGPSRTATTLGGAARGAR